MKNKFKIVNPVPKQQKYFYRIERHFLRSINICLGLDRIKKLQCPPRYIPKWRHFDFFEYEIKDDTVYCYEVDLSKYDYKKYSSDPFSKAVLIHIFKFAQIN